MSDKVNEAGSVVNDFVAMIEGSAAAIVLYRFSLIKQGMPEPMADALTMQFGKIWLSRQLSGGNMREGEL